METNETKKIQDIRFKVNPQEKKDIEQKAKESGLSVSAYVRVKALGLG